MADISQMIADAATRYGVAPALAIEVATQESGMNPDTPDSSAGAVGIFQLEPATAAQLGVDPRDPAQNIDGGVRYLRQMLNQFSDVGEALGAYDWGPGNVSRAISQYGAQWLQHAPGETQSYVSRILGALGTQYTATAPLLVEGPTGPAYSPFPVPGPIDTQVATTGTSFGSALLMGLLAIAALWVFEESF